MISLDPAKRPSFETVLHNARGTIFPESFYSFLHSYIASNNELPSSSPFSGPPSSTPASVPLTPTVSTTSNTTIKASGAATPVPAPSGPGTANGNGGPLPSDADHRIERLWEDYESVEPYVVQEREEGDEDSGAGEYSGSARPYQVTPTYFPSSLCLKLNGGCRTFFRRNCPFQIASRNYLVILRHEGEPRRKVNTFFKISMYISG